MVTVSQNMKSSINLNKPFDCNILCKQAMDLINTYQHNNGNISECVLVMEIKQPLEYQNDSMIPKIEDKK